MLVIFLKALSQSTERPGPGSRPSIRDDLSGGADKVVFCDDYARNLPVTDPLLQQKALNFAKLLRHSNFSSGTGSPSKFRSHPSIVSEALCQTDCPLLVS